MCDVQLGGYGEHQVRDYFSPELGSVFMYDDKNREGASVKGNIEPRIRYQEYAILHVYNEIYIYLHIDI